jgi:hypothetical protein
VQGKRLRVPVIDFLACPGVVLTYAARGNLQAAKKKNQKKKGLARKSQDAKPFVLRKFLLHRNCPDIRRGLGEATQ